MNEAIKSYAKQKNVKLWEIAQELGCYDSTLSKWLRVEMKPDMKKRIKSIIDDIALKHKQAEKKG